MAKFFDVWIKFPQAGGRTNSIRIEAESANDVRQIVGSTFPDGVIRPTPVHAARNPDNYKSVTDDGIAELDTSIFGGFTGRGFGGQSPEELAREGWLEAGVTGPGAKRTRVMDSGESNRILQASSSPPGGVGIGPQGEEGQFFGGPAQIDTMKDFRDRWGSAVNPGWGREGAPGPELAPYEEQANLFQTEAEVGQQPGGFASFMDQYGGEVSSDAFQNIARVGAGGGGVGGTVGGPQGGPMMAANELAQAINTENQTLAFPPGGATMSGAANAKQQFVRDFLAGKIKGYEWIPTADPSEISEAGIVDMANGIWDNQLTDDQKWNFGQKVGAVQNIADTWTPGGDAGPIDAGDLGSLPQRISGVGGGPMTIDPELLIKTPEQIKINGEKEDGSVVNGQNGSKVVKDFTQSDVTAADGTIMPFDEYAQQWGMEAASPLAAYRQGLASRFGGDIPGGAFSRFMESQYNPYLSVFQVGQLANTLQPGGIQALQPTGMGGAMGAAADMQGVMDLEDPIVGFPAPKPQTFEQFTGTTTLPQLGQQAGALLERLRGMGVGTDQLRRDIPSGVRQILRPESYDQVQNALGLLQAAQQQRYSPIAARAFNPRGVRQEDIFADYIRQGGGATTPENFLEFAAGRYGL